MPIYAIVVQDHGDFDDVANRSMPALQAAGLNPLYLSNPMNGTWQDVEECDFEAWVISHGELLEVLDAEDEPYPQDQYVRILAGLASKALRAISDQIDANGLARQDFDRALDAWDEFEQSIQPVEWSWDKNDDVWDRPCPVCGAGPLDLKGHGAVCPNGHITEEGTS